MTSGQTFAIRFIGWTILALALLTNIDLAAKTSVTRAPVATSANELVEAHGCSNAVDYPTHVVVTINGLTRYAGQKMTNKAIEQAVFGIDHGLTIHSFCD